METRTATKAATKKVTEKTEVENLKCDLELKQITENTFNPRTVFSETEMEDLTVSVSQHGVIQPVIVRPKGNKFELVVGTRRYRASVRAKRKTIPVQIRELTDDQAFELAVTENLQREDIAPLEEAAAFKTLSEKSGYDVEAISKKTGKSESYVRSRIRLNRLTPNFAELLQKETINISVALELAQYSEELQQTLYKNHFESDHYYNSWRNLPAKVIVKKVEDQYSTDLTTYKFDKTECRACPFNTQLFSLFPEDGKDGHCTNRSCLSQKNAEYVIESICTQAAKDPTLSIICSHGYDKNVVRQLEEQGFEIDPVYHYQRKPEQPVRDDYEDDDDFQIALDGFNIEAAEFEEEVSSGKIAPAILITGHGTEKVYTAVREPQPEKKQPSTSDILCEEIKKLEKKDVRNKEIANEKIFADTQTLMFKHEIIPIHFTEAEEQMLNFILLDALRNPNYDTLGISASYYKSNEEKLKAVAALTPEQKNIIRRDFLITHLTKCTGIATALLIDFARLHHPESLAAIEKVHNDTYDKRHASLQKRIDDLKLQLATEGRLEDQEQSQDADELQSPQQETAVEPDEEETGEGKTPIAGDQDPESSQEPAPEVAGEMEADQYMEIPVGDGNDDAERPSESETGEPGSSPSKQIGSKKPRRKKQGK